MIIIIWHCFVNDNFEGGGSCLKATAGTRVADKVNLRQGGQVAVTADNGIS